MKQFIFFIGILLAAFITVAQPCVSIVAPQLSENTRKDFEQKLSVAKTEYEKDTLNADAIIWYGRRTAYLGGYMKAIDIFSRGILIDWATSHGCWYHCPHFASMPVSYTHLTLPTSDLV